MAAGLYPGMELRLVEQSDREIRFWAEGREHALTPVLAANISVVPLPLSPELAPEAAVERLCDLQVDAKARYQNDCSGLSRRCGAAS